MIIRCIFLFYIFRHDAIMITYFSEYYKEYKGI